MGAAWRTVHSGTVSPAPRSRAAPLPAPRVCDLWCLVCTRWRSCDSGERRRGSEWPFRRAPLTAHSAPPHCAQQAPTPTMVCGGGGGAPAVAGEGEGVVKGLCARMQAHADVRQCAMLASQRGLTPLSLPPPPQTLACALLIFLLTPRLGCARSPCCLPLSPSLSAFRPQPPSPSVSPSASLSFTWL